jgi:hypothetical protein
VNLTGEGPDRLGAHARRADEWPAPRLVPASYPGATPDGHYLLVGDDVLPMTVAGDGAGLRAALPDGTSVAAALAEIGAAPLAERVPVLAYGANRSPHTLAVKFAHHGDGDRVGGGAPGPAAVPVLAVTVEGIDVVAAGLSPQGYLYADMAPSPGTRVAVKVTLLDRAQARAVHASEGVGHGVYDCARIPGVAVAGTDLTLDALAYAGCVPVFVSPATGTPLAFAAVAATGRRFDAFEQVAMLAHLIETTGVRSPLEACLPGLEPAIGGEDPAVPAAREVVKLLSGQWWYAHNTGDAPMAAANRVQQILWDALGRHFAPESTAGRMAAAGQVLDAESAYDSGPELRLGAQFATE